MELDGMGQLTYYLYSADIYHFVFQNMTTAWPLGWMTELILAVW
jgi:hypothetical protein